jgi:hypothetical protein
MIHFFTSVASNYLAKARTLADSIKRQHPEAVFTLLLCDDLPENLNLADEPFDAVLSIEDLPIPDLSRWIFMHSVVELCTAVKGAGFQELIHRHPDAEAVFYFDPDIVVFDSLEPLLAKLKNKSVLVTPHITEPEKTLDAIIDNEINILKHGIYNLGFLCVNPGERGRQVIDWWAERLYHFCYDNKQNGLFTDQRWIDLASLFFSESFDVVREPEYNVATWNLTQRRATGCMEDGILINGRPLGFYHFSGFDSGAQEIMLNKYGRDMPALYELREWYIQACGKNGQNEVMSIPWRYGHYDNGQLVTREQRKLYRTREDLQQAFPNPFATGDLDRSYYHWSMAREGAEE